MYLKNTRQRAAGLFVAGLMVSTALLFGNIATDVAAEDLPREAVLPLSLAATASSTALDKCAKDGYRVTVAVVDRSGILRVQMRGDGAGPHTVESSMKKAYTSASLRGPSGDLAEMIAKLPATQGLRDMNNNILILAGGLPIEIGGEVVGGIGVGGAPGGQLDAACAQAGLDSIGAKPKFSPAK
ncbi:MAG: heme-binding protein [Nitrospira sp.]|nr:heme-binding protein [Nitrospira sp.]